MVKSNAFADETKTEKFLPKEIALVELQGNGVLSEHIIYREDIIDFKKANTVFNDHIDSVDFNKMDLLIGYGDFHYPNGNTTVIENILYVVLNTTQIPKSDLSTTRQITSVELQGLVNPSPTNVSNSSEILVSVSPCYDNSWNRHQSSSIDYLKDWNTLTPENCYLSAVAESSNIIQSSDLPKIYSWDVTNSVVKDWKNGSSNLNFLILATPCIKGKPCLGLFEYGNGGFVQFSSLNYSASTIGLGSYVIPTFVVTYTESPAYIPALAIFAENTLLPIAAIFGASIYGVYKTIKK